ncbi:MAG: hypothetical protein SGARI_006985, partial [Bacillariaceae sp.]
NLFASALEAFHNHHGDEWLDIVDVGHLRLASKSVGKYASRMALDRMKGIKLSCQAMVDGMTREVEDPSELPKDRHLYRREEEEDEDEPYYRGPKFTIYDPSTDEPLLMKYNTETKRFCPQGTSPEMTWDSGELINDRYTRYMDVKKPITIQWAPCQVVLGTAGSRG